MNYKTDPNRVPFESQAVSSVNSIYCEIINNRTVIIFVAFQRNTIFPLIVACSVCNHKCKNPGINGLCKNHDNLCPRIKVLSQHVFQMFPYLLKCFCVIVLNVHIHVSRITPLYRKWPFRSPVMCKENVLSQRASLIISRPYRKNETTNKNTFVYPHYAFVYIKNIRAVFN
jgi:hypothetical protein